jgi:hypothetical protein
MLAARVQNDFNERALFLTAERPVTKSGVLRAAGAGLHDVDPTFSIALEEPVRQLALRRVGSTFHQRPVNFFDGAGLELLC